MFCVLCLYLYAKYEISLSDVELFVVLQDVMILMMSLLVEINSLL